MQTESSASTTLSRDEDDDTMVFIIVGVLVPLSLLLLIFICCVCRQKRKSGEKEEEEEEEILTQKSFTPSPLLLHKHVALKQQQPFQSPIPSAYTGRVSHGVSEADLKFIVPQYNALLAETEAKRSQSPKFNLPATKHMRHQSAPVGPTADYSDDVPMNAALRNLRSRDSTPERPSSRASNCEEVHGICVQMYTSESDGDSTAATDSEERLASQGKLRFCVEIDWLQNKIKIHLKEALRLRSKSMKGSINPSIRVSIHPDAKKTKYHTRPHNSANPTINETFLFHLPRPTMCQKESENVCVEQAESLSHDITHFKDLEIRLALFHCDIFSRKSEAGLITFQPFDGCSSVIPISHPIFQTGGIEVWRDFKNDDEIREMQRESRGQVLISLCRDPDKQTLSIGILKGKDINTQLASSDSSTLVYGKISLIQGGKVLKSKKTNSAKKQQNPVFNETIRFRIKTSWLDKISVTVSICARNVLGSSKPLGRVTVGPVMYTCGSGLEHWNDMMSAPKSGVAQWHHIY